ncbi:MAG: GAF domain-containing protein [Chitinivibrionales bacterium]|nr:GAF domain-containing protein [Chitinivibrionales bacterium]
MLLRSRKQDIAIVGINKEASTILGLLLNTDGPRVIRVINPQLEDLNELTRYPTLDIIVNATDDQEILERLKRLNMKRVDIISSLSARILYLSGSKELSQEQLSQERERILKSLHEIKQAVLLSKNKEELLKLFLEVAIGSCNADSGSIMLVDSQKRLLNIEMADGLNVDIVRTTAQKFGKGIAGKVAQTGKSFLINGEPGILSEGEGRKDIISSISCPLVIGNEVVGVLNLNSKRYERIFNKADLRYIEELTSFAADVVKASKDFELTTTSAFSLSLLGRIQAILNLEFPFPERLNLLLMKVVTASHGVICNYYEFDDKSRIFLVKASSSFNMNLLQGKKIKLNAQLTTQVLKAQKTVTINVPEKDSFQQKWYIAHPIKVRKQMAGLLFLHLISPKKEVHEEQEILERIGEMIAHELNANAEREFLRIQSAKLSAVSEASFNIASAKDISELINFALPNVCLILEAEAGIFWLQNPVAEKLEVYKSFAIDNQGGLPRLEKLDAEIHDALIPGNGVVLIEDLRAEGFAPSGNYPHSLLRKTFGREGRVAGVLSLYGKKSLDLFGSQKFTEHDKEVFLKFCLQFFKGLSKLMPYFDEKR